MSTDETINDGDGARAAQPTAGSAFEILRESAAREIAAVEWELRAIVNAQIERLAERERFALEVESILGRDLYALLRDAERRHALRTAELERAEAEAREAVRARASVVLTEGASVSAAGLRVVAIRGRVKWDDKGLMRAIAQPAYAWLSQYRTESAPTLRIESEPRGAQAAGDHGGEASPP